MSYRCCNAGEREGLLDKTYAFCSVYLGIVSLKIAGSKYYDTEVNVIVAVRSLGEIAVVFFFVELALYEVVYKTDIWAFGSRHEFSRISALPVVDIYETFKVERAVAIVIACSSPSAEDDTANNGVCKY